MKVTTNAPKVSKNLERYSHILSDNATRTVAEVAKYIVEEAVEATPVDTGKARSGWTASKAGPVFISEPNIVDPQTTITTASSAIGRTANAVDVTNGVGYIGKLNSGTSTQAPAGFVRSAVTKAIIRLKGVRLLKPGSLDKFKGR